MVFASPQDKAIFCRPVVNPLHQVFFGLPLFSFPWGFLSKACFVMLEFFFPNVWPIHFHLQVFIVVEIGSWLVRCNNAVLLMVLDHLIPKMVRRQRLTNICRILMVDVPVHVFDL